MKTEVLHFTDYFSYTIFKFLSDIIILNCNRPTGTNKNLLNARITHCECKLQQTKSENKT